MYNVSEYCLEGECWRAIPGYEGIYEASDFGRIRSVDGKITHSVKHGIRRWNGRIIKPKGSNPRTGYRVTLWRDKKSIDYLVCRLVGMAFLGVPDDLKMTINHIDGNRFNNHISNLEWLSLADNIRHAFDNDLIGTNKRVTLLYEGIKLEFASLTKASLYIGKNHGYLSTCLKKNQPIVDRHGNVYTIA